MEHFKNDHKLSYLKVEDPPESAASSPRPLSPHEQVLVQTRSAGSWTGWLWEIVSCVMAVGSLVGIIVVLYVFDGQSTPDWPYGITLNALISVLVTIMKAAMAFPLSEALSQLKWSWFNEGNRLSDLALLDAASRGAFGAVIVLFRFLPRHLVTVGCFVVVIAAAIAPFVQQVISIEMRPVHSSEQSSIQVCNTSTYNDWGEGSGPGMNKVPLSTTGALYTGIFESQSPNSNSITMDCPTGNCTFAPYQTLGFCSRCANITESLDLNISSGYSITSRSYDYTLPNGWNFTTSMSMQYLMNATSSRDLVKVDATDLALVNNFTAITAAGYGVPPGISAAECALYFCVQTYEATVSNGRFKEKLVETGATSNYSVTTASTGNIALTPDTCYYNGTRQAGNEHCTYEVSWLSQLAMSNSLSPLLKGTGSLFVSNRPDWSSETARAIYGQQGNLTEITSMFTSLASSLTTHARSKVCDATVSGTTWKVESYVRVSWLWMILPIALVVFTLVFFIATIFNTRNQFIWKSSPLALLFSDLNMETPDAFQMNPDLSKMEQISETIKAKLETTANGVRLKAHLH